MSQIQVGPPPPRSYARLWISTILLIAYASFVLLMTMWPNPEQLEFDSIASRVLNALHNIGIPESFGYNKLEFTANIGMFIPLGFLLGLALPRRAWWLAIFLIPAFSGAIEFTQGLALDQRVSTMLDVLANTLGGYTGIFLALVMRAMIYARDRTMIERELWERRVAAARLQQERATAEVHTPNYEPDLVTRLLDPSFWDDDNTPTTRMPTM